MTTDLAFTAHDLINSGMAWRLEGSIGRQSMDAMENGQAILGPTGTATTGATVSP